jgi:hypothetical protein
MRLFLQIPTMRIMMMIGYVKSMLVVHQYEATTHINTFINKVFTYERNPPLTNYAKTAFFCGFDAKAYGSGEGEGCKIYIKNTYIPSGWTYRWEYDSETTNHKTEVLSNLNLGHNLVNHIDHSNTDFMGTGYTNHYQGINTNDALSRTNGNKQSIIYSVGCYACDFLLLNVLLRDLFITRMEGLSHSSGTHDMDGIHHITQITIHLHLIDNSSDHFLSELLQTWYYFFKP